MARTLVIPDADFSTHKIETVSFDPVPPVPTLELAWAWATGGISGDLASYSISTSLKYITAFGKGVSVTEHEMASTTDQTVEYPYSIKIPQGTTKVKITATDKTAFYDGTGARIVWTEDVDSGVPGSNVHKIKGIQRDDFNCSMVPVEINVPANADSFILTMRFTDAQSFASADACAEHYGINIEFI